MSKIRRCSVCYGDCDASPHANSTNRRYDLCIECFWYGRNFAMQHFKGDYDVVNENRIKDEAKKHMDKTYQVANIMRYGAMPKTEGDES